MENKKKIILVLLITIFIIISSYSLVFYSNKINNRSNNKIIQKCIEEDIKIISKTYNFSEPNLIRQGDYIVANIKEAEFQSMGDGRPVMPYNLTKYILPFGSKILNVDFTYLNPEPFYISKKMSYASCSTLTKEDEKIYDSIEPYPEDFVSFKTGGGLDGDEHKTFLNIRVNPLLYIPKENKLNFSKQIKVDIYYKEPDKTILEENNDYDLLIITPSKFSRQLNRLVEHKNNSGVITKLVTTESIYEDYKGTDEAEKIKICIKEYIEKYGIKNVLLLGGLDGQTQRWNLPARYSNVVIREGTQEFVVPEYLSDLYFADIYDSEGNFSSWDTNNNNKYSEYKNKTIDEIDLYPDVRLGRLPCRNRIQVKTMVDKIINYENQKVDDWFKNIVLVSGDHWKDKNGVLEGVKIMEKAADIMDDFEPVNLFATENNKLLVKDINKAINNGCGIAYFCGHGSPKMWGIYYPGEEKTWAPSLLKSGQVKFYKIFYMNFLRNRYKLPITLVGGCNNGQFDETIFTYLKKGKPQLSTSCWAWKLTSQKNGGSIATIANTDLGTHAMDDSDFNGVNDYLEVYDGWLELKFFELYSKENINDLGTLHQKALTEYLNIFLLNNDEMDIKMVQQWELLGDPSLQIKEI